MTLVHGVWPILAVKLLSLAFFAFLLVYFQQQLIHREKLIRNTLWGLSAGLATTTTMGVLMLFGIHL